MARDTLEQIHERALMRFDQCYNAQWAVREKVVEAMRFARIPGAQWEGSTAAGTDIENQFESFPKYEVNKVASELNRIISEYRNNRIVTKYRPSDKDASDELAQKLNGKFLADVEETDGGEAFDNAFDDAVTGGFGAWRLSVADDEGDIYGERQRIIFEPIYDAARSVWFDPDAKKYDKSDAQFCFYMYSISPEKYKYLYGEDAPTSMKSLSFNIVYDWFRPNVVYIAKYYERVIENTEIITFINPLTQEEQTYYKDELSKIEDELEMAGFEEVSRKSVKRPCVYCYLMDGNRFLEKKVEVPGGMIPIVPVYGKRWFIDDIERIEGHVQKAMDAQRIYNLQVSQLADIAGKSNDELPIFDPEQIRGLENHWQFRQQENYSYLVARALRDKQGNVIATGPLGKTTPPQVPPAMAALIQIAGQDIREVTGDSAGLNQLPNNLAEGTVDKIFSRQDTNSFIYMDNMRKSMKRCGNIWLAMCRDVYGSDKEVRVVMEDGTDDIVLMSQEIRDEQTGAIIAMNDLSQGRYDVVVDVGPSYATQRDNAVRNLSNTLATVPPNHPYFDILMSLMIENMDGAGIDEIHPYVRDQMVLKGVVKPRTPEEKEKLAMAQQQQAQQPDPMMIAAQGQMLQGQAELIRAQNDAQVDGVLAMAKVQDSRANMIQKSAQAVKYMAEANKTDVDKVLSVDNTLQQRSQSMYNQNTPPVSD